MDAMSDQVIKVFDKIFRKQDVKESFGCRNGCWCRLVRRQSNRPIPVGALVKCCREERVGGVVCREVRRLCRGGIV